jgi:hypothetical protein
MPVSGFPNQTAYVHPPTLLFTPLRTLSIRATQEDEMGQLYLTNVDFLRNGVPASVIAALVSLPHFHRYTECSPHGTTGCRITRLCVDEAYSVRGFFLPYTVLILGSRHFQSGLTWRGCERRTGASSAHSDPRLLLAHISLLRLLNLSKRDSLRSTIERRPEDSRRGIQ